MKKIVLACGLLLGLFAVGCGGNACEAAADDILAKYDECGIEVASTSNSSGSVECTEALGKQQECLAACTTAASCDTLKGMDPDGAVEYAECLGGC